MFKIWALGFKGLAFRGRGVSDLGSVGFGFHLGFGVQPESPESACLEAHGRFRAYGL